MQVRYRAALHPEFTFPAFRPATLPSAFRLTGCATGLRYTLKGRKSKKVLERTVEVLSARFRHLRVGEQ